MRGLTAGLLVAGLALAGCGEDDPTPDVQVTLVEYAIAIEGEVTAGPLVVEVGNIGHAHHNLSICPTDPDDESGDCTGPPQQHTMLRRPEAARDPSFYDDVGDSLTIGKDWTALVEYDLAPGTYRFFCGIISHAEKGMEQVVTVTG